MSTKRAVTVIPPTVNLHTFAPLSSSAKRRVAGYARVSTDDEEQLTSYDAQVDYYTRFITEHEDWEFVGLYSDEGISGTSINRRKGFQKMIADALAGKIDLIITKSISRFARNTVDSISTVRLLKDKGVEVYFEKDGLWTFDQSAELTITILSSIAQEESRNLSENVKWAKRNGYKNGKVSMTFKRFLGYERGEDGQPIINEEQAELVRRIYKMYVNGMTPAGIAKQLTAENIPTPGNRHLWQGAIVSSILTNEKYKGDALLQKTFCTDFLTKKMKVNEGEFPQYYVTGSHPAIISPELFDHVQQEFKRRKEVGYSGFNSPLSNRIVCGSCGRFYGRKLWHSTDKYRCTVWQCNAKFKNTKPCYTPSLKEDQIEQAFTETMNELIINKGEIITQLEVILGSLVDCRDLEEEVLQLDAECAAIEGTIDDFINRNARTITDQSVYSKQYRALASNYEAMREKRIDLNSRIAEKKSRYVAIKNYLQSLKRQEHVLTTFDAELWVSVIDKAEVFTDKTIVFHLKDGTKCRRIIPEKISR